MNKMNTENLSVPAFIAKLWEMVNKPQYDNLIQWSKEGTSFLIKEPTKFCSDLLPIYCKHNNLSSFCRQLNKYGFRKIAALESSSLKNYRTDLEFAHPSFKKGCPLLLNDIKRHVPEKTKETNYPDVIVNIAGELQQLKQKQGHLESKLNAMKNENSALWREHSLLRHEHQNLQKLINKLIQFLLTLVHQTRGQNIKRFNLPLMLKHRSQSKEDLTVLKNQSCNRESNANIIKNENIEVTVPGILDDSDPSTLLENLNNFDNFSSTNVEVANKEDSSDNLISLVAVPLQEVSPAIVYGKRVDLPNTLERKYVKVGNINKSQKRKLSDKTISIVPKKILKPSSNLIGGMNNKKSVPIFVKIAPKDVETTQNPRYKVVKTDNSNLPESSKTFVINSTPEYQISIIDSGKSNYQDKNPRNESIPIISSSSGTLLSPRITESEDDDKTNKSNPVVIKDQSLEPFSKDVDSHTGAIQSDLDILKDLLQGEGISIDANTLLNFLNEDPLTLNMPEAGSSNSNDTIGNELISYSTPNLSDLVKSLDENESEEYASLSATLNTPNPELLYDFTLPSPSKEMK